MFVNTYDNSGSATDKSYAVYTNAPAGAFTNIDYNDYHTSGAPGVLGFFGSDQTTIAAWRAATGQDLHSFAADPLFTSPTNLHVTNSSSAVSNAATPVAGFTTDVDGDTRDASATHTVTCNIGTMAPSATVNVQITVKPRNEGTLDDTATITAGRQTNSVTVSGNETDPNTSNNSASQVTKVRDAALRKVLLTKQVLTGGCENTTGNVCLTGPAPAGGLTVNLSSNITGAAVPLSVFIPAGQTVSPAFTVTTTHVAMKQQGLITATLGAGTVSRNLTINVGSGSCPP